MKTKKLLSCLIVAIIGGCIPVMSLHPLYTEKDVVFEEGLLGTWLDDPNNPEDAVLIPGAKGLGAGIFLGGLMAGIAVVMFIAGLILTLFN